MSLRIIDGGANTPLAGLVAGTLGVVLSRRVIGRFPDDEAQVQLIDPVAGDDGDRYWKGGAYDETSATSPPRAPRFVRRHRWIGRQVCGAYRRGDGAGPSCEIPTDVPLAHGYGPLGPTR